MTTREERETAKARQAADDEKVKADRDRQAIQAQKTHDEKVRAEAEAAANAKARQEELVVEVEPGEVLLVRVKKADGEVAEHHVMARDDGNVDAFEAPAPAAPVQTPDPISGS